MIHDHDDITKVVIGCRACIARRARDQELARIAEMPDVEIQVEWSATANGVVRVKVKGDPSSEDAYEVADRNESTVLRQIENQVDLGPDVEIDWDGVRWVDPPPVTQPTPDDQPPLFEV